jgi:magnesium chelatase family protein
VVTHYQKRLSGPLLDRFDIHVDVPRVNYEELTSQQVNTISTFDRSVGLAPDLGIGDAQEGYTESWRR